MKYPAASKIVDVGGREGLTGKRTSEWQQEGGEGTGCGGTGQKE